MLQFGPLMWTSEEPLLRGYLQVSVIWQVGLTGVSLVICPHSRQWDLGSFLFLLFHILDIRHIMFSWYSLCHSIPWYSLKNNGAEWPWKETTKTLSQSKIYLDSVSWFIPDIFNKNIVNTFSKKIYKHCWPKESKTQVNEQKRDPTSMDQEMQHC